MKKNMLKRDKNDEKAVKKNWGKKFIKVQKWQKRQKRVKKLWKNRWGNEKKWWKKSLRKERKKRQQKWTKICKNGPKKIKKG